MLPARSVNRSSRVYVFALLAIILVGVGCRVAQYAANRSFWTDEASLVLNIRGHTAGQLLGRLDYEQAAPPLFLLTERLIFCVLGGSEYALRIVPELLGLLSLVVFAILCRRVLPAPWDLVAIALFALADRFIWHSSEVKQYSCELCAAVLLTLLATGDGEGPAAISRLRRTALVAAVTVWFSYSSVLVFAAISLSLLPRIVRMSRRGWLAYAALNLPVAVSFLFVLRLSVSAQQDARLTDMWLGDFLDISRPWAWPWWIGHHLHALCNYPSPSSGPVILAGLVIGIMALLSERKLELLGFLVGPIVVTIAASAAHRYPFDGGRMTLFLDASAILLGVLGYRSLFLLARPQLRPLAISLPAYVVGLSIAWASIHLLYPRNRGHLRPVLSDVKAHVRPDDVLYALEPHDFLCYWPASDPRVRFALPPASQIRQRRFWIIWSFNSDSGQRRREPILAWARTFASQVYKVESNGGEAVLFEKRNSPMKEHRDQPPVVDRTPRPPLRLATGAIAMDPEAWRIP